MGSQNYSNSRFNGNNPSSRPPKGSSTALAAVAIQDHLMQNLSLVDPFKRPLQKLPPAKKPSKGAKAVVDTGRGKKFHKNAKKSAEEREYVLDPKPKPLTLAQKMGIVDAPEQPLSEDQWAKVKDQSNQRDDSIQPCAICKEDFGLHQQVLLSCSHVFHRNCLQAFERFTGRKTCPMCRKQQYQTRVIHEGATYHRHQCATRIQACWRGYVVRSWYRKLRETVPPKDPKLRHKFYEAKFIIGQLRNQSCKKMLGDAVTSNLNINELIKVCFTFVTDMQIKRLDELQAITDRLVRSYDTRVEEFLSQIDRSVADSRSVFHSLDSSTLLRAITEDEWEAIQYKAIERGEKDCPICIMPLGNISEGNVDVDSPRKGKRTTVLLSCTHVFHLCCLEAFEELSLGEHKICPVCRAGYQKRIQDL